MLQISNITKSFGERVVLKEATFQLEKREKCALIGRNGCGKSTLFKLITGAMSLDDGEIITPKGYSVATLDQHLTLSRETVIDECKEVLSSDDELYKAERILFGLGFSEADLLRSPREFSGGYQIRINLCKVLLKEPDLLLLDEPTNYLDIVSLRWLSSFIKRYPGEVILITHDRDFIESTCESVIGIHQGKVRKVRGSVQKYYQLLEEQIDQAEKFNENQLRKKKELERFVERFGAKATKASQAQSKKKMIERLEFKEEAKADHVLSFSFPFESIQAKKLIEIERLSFGYKKDSLLFKELNLIVNRGDRIGVIGPNGKGKTTLLNVLADELKPVEGNFSFHPKVKLAYFGQSNIDRLSPEQTVEREIQASNGDLSREQVRKIAACMMFRGNEADKQIRVLSGGERSRVQLGKVLASSSNLLFLDEPTNHLDVESVEVLCEELETYPGTLLLVSHSEMVLRRLVNRLVIFLPGEIRVFEGGYDEFLEKVGWPEERSIEKESETHKLSLKEKKHLKSQLIKERSAALKPLQKDLERCEQFIDQLEKRKEELEKKMIDFASSDQQNIDMEKVSIELHQTDSSIEEQFLLWEEFNEKIETARDLFEKQLNELEEL